jgi:hypothetical protein
MVIGVSATDTLDQKADFASFGFNCIDLVAPGVSIFSTSVYEPGREVDGILFNKYYDGYWSGTSMAAPMVSATVALIESINPSLRQAQILSAIKENTDNINRLNPSFLNSLGSGRLNVYKAIKFAKENLNNSTISILVAPYSDATSQTKIVNQKGEENNSFLAYHENFHGGVNITAGDVNGDSREEIITGAGDGGGPHVRIFNSSGEVIGQFFAYHENFRGGVNVATGDVNGDGVEEIITGAGVGGGPHVRIFNDKGELISQFFAYHKDFRGGVNVATGDVNGDSIAEIITGAGVGGGPQVRMFKLKGEVVGQFFAYDENFRGGVRVATANLHRGARGKKFDIITSPGIGGGPHIRIFDSGANIMGQFFAYDKKFKGGVIISTADIDYDGFDELITGAGPGGTPHARVFEATGVLINSFLGLEREFSGGINVAGIKIKR